MSFIVVGQDEPIDHVLRRFKKECLKAGVLSEFSRRKHYEKPSVRRRRKYETARRRERRRMLKMTARIERD